MDMTGEIQDPRRTAGYHISSKSDNFIRFWLLFRGPTPKQPSRFNSKVEHQKFDIIFVFRTMGNTSAYEVLAIIGLVF